MTETYWCPGPWPWQWFRTCTREVPDPPPPDPCNAPACIDAKNRLKAARDGFNSICDALRVLREIARVLQQVISTPIWILIALVVIMAIATAIGGLIGILAVIILGLLAVYAISWLLFFVVGRIAVEFGVVLEKRRTEFTQALTDVVAQCPEHCCGDISIPDCNLE